MGKIHEKVTSKLGILFILIVLMWLSRNTGLVYLLVASIIAFIYYNELREGRDKVSRCLIFLFFEASLVALAIWVVIVPKLNFKGDILLNQAIKGIVFIVIYCLLYVVVAFSAELETARFTILIITAVVSILYLIVTTVVNLIPLSVYAELFKQYIKDEVVVQAILSEYDGRVIFNIFIQIFTYPMWIAALIGGTVIAGRDYCLKKKITFKSMLLKIKNKLIKF